MSGGSGRFEPPVAAAVIADSTEDTLAIASTPVRAWRGIVRPAAKVAPKSTASQIPPAAIHGRADRAREQLSEGSEPQHPEGHAGEQET